jgi:DNA-binding transcriptional ArsR family regulator
MTQSGAIISYYEKNILVMPTTPKTKPKKQQEYKDIITYEPLGLKIVDDEKSLQILKDPNLFPIIAILRKQPMTVKEIESAYSEEAKKHDTHEPKSDKTIYRYLKTLEDAGLVTPAGQRVVIGKTATETLFSRTAHIFLTIAEESKWWGSKDGQEFVKKIGFPVGYNLGDYEPSIECLTKFMVRLDNARETEFANLAAAEDAQLISQLSGKDWHHITKLLFYIGLFSVFLKQPELIEDLRRCFKKRRKKKSK